MMRVAVALLFAMLSCASAFGATQPMAFDIAAGPLEPALQRFGEQTGIQILYDPALLQGRLTRGLQGTLSPEQALQSLLASTDIAFSFTGADAVGLFRKAAPAAVQTPHEIASVISPRTVTISANRERENSYNTRVSMAATKVDGSQLLVPIASESLTAAILRDRRVTRLENALEYVSAAEIAPNGQSALGFILRGFPTYQYYLDGVRVSPDLHHDGFRDMANIERIEVVKGPASLVYGRTEPGGAINIITKQPLEEPHLAWEQQIGSFNRKRTQFDAGGPLSGRPELLYRFNAAYEAQSSFRGIPNRRLFLAPVLTWKLSEATSLTTYAEYLNSRDRHDTGLPVIGNHLPPVPISRSLESGSEVHTQDWRVGLRGFHAIGDNWTVRLHLDARWTDSPRSVGLAVSDDGLASSGCLPSACPVQRELVATPVSRGRTYFASLDAVWNTALWRMHHTVLMGIDEFQSHEYSEPSNRSDPSLATDLFNPRVMQIPVTLLQRPDWSARDSIAEQWLGLYGQDQVQLTDTVYLLAGVRYDIVNENVGNTARDDDSFPNFTDRSGGSTRLDALKARGGVVWHPKPWLSLYANYAQNFGVTAGLYVSGSSTNPTFLPGEVANEWETGVKFASADGRIAASLAWFNLTKLNIASSVLEPALDHTGGLYSVMDGARTNGLELELHGEIAPGLQLLASYAYLDSRIENTNLFFINPIGAELIGTTGNRLAGVPRHGGSLWMTYHLPAGALQGLKLGGGTVIRGHRAGDNANDYELPGFARLDALAAYSWRAANTNFSLQLNINNALNKRYYESLSGTRTVVPGAPRNWLVTLGAQF